MKQTLEGKTIWVVEDNPDLQKNLKAFLREEGANVEAFDAPPRQANDLTKSWLPTV